MKREGKGQKTGSLGSQNIMPEQESLIVQEMSTLHAGSSTEDMIVGNTERARDILNAQTGVEGEIERGSDEEEVDSTEHEGSSSGGNSTTERLVPHQLREQAARHIGRIGRHFNILDRLFKKHTQQSSDLQQGAMFDGVFSNLSAKPDTTETENNNEQDIPPTYDEAAADMAPSYYGMDLNNADIYYDEICIEGLPVGNIANLLWNIIVSTSFQFIGFLITYILHTSHAAKQGSRFGLGLTFIGYGYSMIPNDVSSKVGKNKSLNRMELEDPNEFDDVSLNQQSMTQDKFESHLNHGLDEEKQSIPSLAIIVGLLGAFITFKSIYDYIQVKKMEKKYLNQSPNQA